MLYNKIGIDMDKWVKPLITAEFRRFLTLYEVCNTSATSCAMRMPGARDLYPFPRRSTVSSIMNDPYYAEVYRSVLLDADVSRDASLPMSCADYVIESDRLLPRRFLPRRESRIL